MDSNRDSNKGDSNRDNKGDRKDNKGDSSKDNKEDSKDIINSKEDSKDKDMRDEEDSKDDEEEKINQYIYKKLVKKDDPPWLKKIIEENEYEQAMKKISAQIAIITQNLVDKIISRLERQGNICIKSHSEADFVLAHLYRSGQVNYVFGDDGDLFVFGVGCLVKKLV